MRRKVPPHEFYTLQVRCRYLAVCQRPPCHEAVLHGAKGPVGLKTICEGSVHRMALEDAASRLGLSDLPELCVAARGP